MTLQRFERIRYSENRGKRKRSSRLSDQEDALLENQKMSVEEIVGTNCVYEWDPS